MEQGRMMADTSRRPGTAPQNLGPWTILARVGSGGMGVVYKASRADLGDRPAALKVIRPGLLEDLAVQARFAREVEVLRRVRDVHISEFIDADLTGDPAWLATAFIEGPNLRDHVSAHGPLSERAWWDLARGLSQALAVLEVHAITHRDMKPANVILSPTGAVLIDFGIAVPEDAASLTGTGLVTGSPAWLSPEQANLKPVTTASDIFSLGSLLTFAGTGRPPFGTGAHVAVLLAIATRDPDTIGLSDAQCRLLTAMMAKDPADRPSAREVLQWTKGSGSAVPAWAGRPVPADDPGSSTQVLRPSDLDDTSPDSAPAPTAAVIPVALASAASAAPEPATAALAPERPLPPAGPGDRKRRRPWLPLALIFIAAIAAGIWWFSGNDDTEDPGAAVEPTPSVSTSPTVGPAPPAPGADQLARSGDFLLSPWQINNTGSGGMSVTGTIKNTGTAPASGYATVYVYADGSPIGSASAELPEIAPGASAAVTFTGTDTWQSGQKSVTLVVQ